MKREDSFLYKTTKDNEDTVSELLCNLMCSKYVRDIILKSLGLDRSHFDEIEFNSISTQNNLESDSGRLDIKIETDNLVVYIENKINRDTALQDNQVTSYLSELEEKKRSGYKVKMIYLIPTGYKHESQIKEALTDFAEIVYWEKFLKDLKSYEIHEHNQIFAEVLVYLEDRILQTSIDLKLTGEEVAIMNNVQDLYHANTFLNKFKSIIGESNQLIMEALGTKFDIGNSVGIKKLDEDDNSIGQYLSFNGDEWSLFYGFNFNVIDEFDSKFNDFVFSVSLDRKYLKNADSDKFDILNDPACTWVYIKISKFVMTDENPAIALSNEVERIIKGVILGEA